MQFLISHVLRRPLKSSHYAVYTNFSFTSVHVYKIASPYDTKRRRQWQPTPVLFFFFLIITYLFFCFYLFYFFTLQYCICKVVNIDAWFCNTSIWIRHGRTGVPIPWVEEPCRLQSMGSWRVGHNWATSLSLFTFMHWRRKWRPTPVFLPGESQGRGLLVGCRLWGLTESDTTEAT